MKILPPYDDERVYAWIILPICLAFLVVSLVLGAVFDTWGQSGIYENLFTEAVGVVAEIGLIFLLLNAWIDRAEKRRWEGARRDLLRSVEDCFVDLLMATSALFEAVEDRDHESAANAGVHAVSVLKKLSVTLAARQIAISADMASHLSTVVEEAQYTAKNVERLAREFNERSFDKFSKHVVRQMEYGHNKMQTSLLAASSAAGFEDIPSYDGGFTRNSLMYELPDKCKDLVAAIVAEEDVELDADLIPD